MSSAAAASRSKQYLGLRGGGLRWTESYIDPKTWSPILQQAVKAQELGVIPFNLELDYDYWTYRTYVGE
jgi:hypothetical protein